MERISFIKAATLWKAEKARRIKATSLSAYSLTVQKHLEPRFLWLDDITTESVQRLADEELEAGNNLITVKGIIKILKMIIRFCEEQGWMEERKYDVIFPKREGKPNPQVLPVEDEKRLLAWLAENPTLPNIGLMICLCCGLRIGEVCGLKWEDIDCANRVLHVRRTVHRVYNPDSPERRTELTVGVPKTQGSRREGPLPDKLAGMLNKYSSKVSGRNYLLSRKPWPLDPQTFRYHFDKATARLGLPHRKVHSLRHTFATRCAENNRDWKTLSALLGHSDISTTLNLYVHPSLEQKRRCVADMMKGL